MAFIETVGQAIVDLLISVLNSAVLVIPGIVAALVVLIIGFIIGSAFEIVVRHLLQRSRLDQQLIKARISGYMGHISISALLAGILKWYILAFFISEAANQARLGVLSELLAGLAAWIPNLLAAVVIMISGMLLAEYAADKTLHAKRKGIRIVSGIVRWFILVFVALIALDQIGINIALATNTMLILVGAIALGLAIAIGMGFGFALKDEAKGILKALKRNL